MVISALKVVVKIIVCEYFYSRPFHLLSRLLTSPCATLCAIDNMKLFFALYVQMIFPVNCKFAMAGNQINLVFVLISRCAYNYLIAVSRQTGMKKWLMDASLYPFYSWLTKQENWNYLYWCQLVLDVLNQESDRIQTTRW